MMYRKIEFQNYLIAFVFSLAVHDLLILEQSWKENKFCKKRNCQLHTRVSSSVMTYFAAILQPYVGYYKLYGQWQLDDKRKPV